MYLEMVKDIVLDLKKNFNDFKIFSNFAGNPIGENVEEGVIKFKERNFKN